jgi:hypothetical protein
MTANNSAFTSSDSASIARSPAILQVNAGNNHESHSPHEASTSRETTGASRVETAYWRNNCNIEDAEE